MIYGLLEYLKDRIESSTNFKAMILPALPGVYALNTAYIIVPDNVNCEFAITSEMFSSFVIDIFFVTSDCNVDDISTMTKNIAKAYSSAKSLVNDVLPRGARMYADNDIDASCSDVSVSMKSWLVANRIPISTHLSTRWKALIKG